VRRQGHPWQDQIDIELEGRLPTTIALWFRVSRLLFPRGFDLDLLGAEDSTNPTVAPSATRSPSDASLEKGGADRRGSALSAPWCCRVTAERPRQLSTPPCWSFWPADRPVGRLLVPGQQGRPVGLAGTSHETEHQASSISQGQNAQ
jgi:hypothetical protein